MPKGEEIFADFVLSTNQESSYKTGLVDVPTATFTGCSDAWLVFTDGIGSDTFKNDISSVREKYSSTITTVVMVLQQQLNGDWADVDTLNDNTFGTFYHLGHVVDDFKNKYIGYKINWKEVYNDFGEGQFRVKFNETSIFGATTNFSQEFCLKLYHANFADGTVKIEFYTNKIRGDIKDPFAFLDFADTNWYNSIRLTAFFGADKSSYENEFVEYNNGAESWIKSEQKVSYNLTIKPVDAITHNFIKTDVIQADSIVITDYNKNNPNRHVQTPVLIDGAYEPNWKAASLKASVEVQFKLSVNNLRKKRC